jgi:hypothetical protein
MESPNLNDLTGEPRKLCEQAAKVIDEQVAAGAFTASGLAKTVSLAFLAGYAKCEQDYAMESPCSEAVQ